MTVPSPFAKASGDLSPIASAKGDQSPLTYVIHRTPQPVVIDGRLDDPIWSRAPAMGQFWLPDGKSTPRHPTSAWMCWDDHYLYLAARATDPYIFSTCTKRDEPLYQQEVIEVFLDPTGKLTRYFEFEVSPGNVIWDGIVDNPELSDKKYTANIAWNAEGLKTAVQVVGKLNDPTVRSQEWTVEMALPFADLEIEAPAVGNVWRANVFRIDRAKDGDEFTSWSPVFGAKPAFHVPTRFGYLKFAAAVP